MIQSPDFRIQRVCFRFVAFLLILILILLPIVLLQMGRQKSAVHRTLLQWRWYNNILLGSFKYELSRRSREWCGQSIFRTSSTAITILNAVRDRNQDPGQVYHELAHVCRRGSLQFRWSNLGHVKST